MMNKLICCCVIFILICTKSVDAEDLITRLNSLNKYLNQKKGTAGFNYNAKGKRDPFVPLIGAEQFLRDNKELSSQEKDSLPSLPSITEMKNLYPFALIGIIHSQGGKSLAIINDKILGKGDEISGAKVLEIEQNNVKLLWKKKIISLSIKEESFKTGGTK